MLEQVETALRSVKIEPKDEAAAELARHYAHLIDNAAPAAKYVEALEWLRVATVAVKRPGESMAAAETRADKMRQIIEVALSEHSSASDFGPKLLATLTALGMTPAAAGTVATPVSTNPKSPLDELRQARERRERESAS